MKKSVKRSIRVRSGSDSEEEVANSSRPSAKTHAPARSTAGAVLSFDEGGDDDLNGGSAGIKQGQFKKTKFKKMMQAPVVLPEPEEPVQSEAYSSGALEALRQQQQFKGAATLDSLEEGMQLNSADVEYMEELQAAEQLIAAAAAKAAADADAAAAARAPAAEAAAGAFYSGSPLSAGSVARQVADVYASLEEEQQDRTLRLSQLTGRVAADVEAAASLRKTLQPQLKELHALGVLRELAMALVELLREKQPLLLQLQQSGCSRLRAAQAARRRGRTEAALDALQSAKLALEVQTYVLLRVESGYLEQAAAQYSAEGAKVDAFGRSVQREGVEETDEALAERHLAARAARRGPRRKLRTALQLRDGEVSMEVSADEGDGAEQLARERDACLAALAEAAEVLFEDAREDLCSVQAVLNALTHMRAGDDGDAIGVHYHQMYISLSLPQLLQPLLLLEMLRKVFTVQADFAAAPFALLQDCEWYQNVDKYARSVGVGTLGDLNASGEDAGLADGDATLLLRVLAQAYVPYLAGMWDIAWDPLDAKQAELCSANLRTMRDLAQSAPASPAQSELLAAVSSAAARVCALFRGILLAEGAPFAMLPALSFGEEEFDAAEDEEAGDGGVPTASGIMPSSQAQKKKKSMFQIVIKTTSVPLRGPSSAEMSQFHKAYDAIKPAVVFIESQLRSLTFALCNLSRFSNLTGDGADPALALVLDVLRCPAVRASCTSLLRLQRLELKSTEGSVLSGIYCTVGKLYAAGGVKATLVNVSVATLEDFSRCDTDTQVQRIEVMIEEVKK